MSSLTISLRSSWASLNDYISADAYNRLKEDVLNVSKARNMITEDNINTSTKKEITIPADKTAGEIVKLNDIIELQNIARNTVSYEGLNKDYDFKNPKTLSKPLALLYNEVRQVVVHMYMGSSCVNNCSTSCKTGCSTNCYIECTSQCSNNNCSEYCLNNCLNGCKNSGCKNECTVQCTISNCSYESNDSCSVETCKQNCKDNCSINNCEATCSISCFNSCHSDCGNTCQYDISCSGTCYMQCSDGCGTDNTCNSLVTGSNPMIESKIVDINSIDGKQNITSYSDGSSEYIKKIR